MKLSAIWKVLVIICMVFTFVACDMNIDKVSPPDWIQGTWESDDNVFTFTTNDIIHIIKGPSEGFTATDSEFTVEDVKYSIDSYQIELSKGGVSEKYKFMLFSYLPDELKYYHADSAGVFPNTATDTLDREH